MATTLNGKKIETGASSHNLPPAAASGEAEAVKKATHHEDCGEVGETGEHGELGENAAEEKTAEEK